MGEEAEAEVAEAGAVGSMVVVLADWMVVASANSVTNCSSWTANLSSCCRDWKVNWHLPRGRLRSR